ncbi:MAG: zinc ribbon domain-containing protein [Planctomycetota bacterium]
MTGRAAAPSHAPSPGDRPTDLGDVFAAAIVAPLLLRTAVKYADRSTTLRAWLTHLALLLPGMFVVIEAVGFARRASFGWFAQYELGDATRRLFRSAGSAEEVGLTIVTAAAVAQSICVLLAWLFAAWGGGRERWSRTLLRSIRRAWVLWFALTIYLTIAILAAHAVRQAGQWLGTQSALYLSSTSYGALRYGVVRGLDPDNLALLTAVGALLLMLIGWMRAMRPPAMGLSCRWPAVCNRCGYAVTALSPEADCPECGRAVAKSLSPRSWDDVAGLGRWPWSRPRPTTFGSRIPGLDPGVAFRALRLRRALVGVLLIGLLTPAWLQVWIDLTTEAEPMRYGETLPAFAAEEPEVAIAQVTRWAVLGLTAGLSAVLSGLVLTLSASTLTAGTLSRKTAINPGPIACACAAAAARCLPAWYLLGVLTAMALVLPQVERWIDADQKLLGVVDPMTAVLAVPAFVHLSVFAVYAWCVNRAALGARYANH